MAKRRFTVFVYQGSALLNKYVVTCNSPAEEVDLIRAAARAAKREGKYIKTGPAF